MGWVGNCSHRRLLEGMVLNPSYKEVRVARVRSQASFSWIGVLGRASSIGQLNWITIRRLAVAETKRRPLPDLTEACSTRHQRLPQGSEVLGIEDDLRPLPAWR